MHLYTMSDDFEEGSASYEFHMMGLFKTLNSTPPYSQQKNDIAIGYKTVSMPCAAKSMTTNAPRS